MVKNTVLHVRYCICKVLIRQPAPFFLAFPAAVSPVIILSRLFAKTTLSFNITFVFYLPVLIFGKCNFPFWTYTTFEDEDNKTLIQCMFTVRGDL